MRFSWAYSFPLSLNYIADRNTNTIKQTLTRLESQTVSAESLKRHYGQTSPGHESGAVDRRSRMWRGPLVATQYLVTRICINLALPWLALAILNQPNKHTTNMVYCLFYWLQLGCNVSRACQACGYRALIRQSRLAFV
jgi:hypothetical protein